MAKLTSQQRDYFKDRIHDQFDNHLQPLEKVATLKKSELVDEKFETFIAELGLENSLEELTKVEIRLQAIQQTVATHMENLKTQYDMPSSNYGKKEYRCTAMKSDGDRCKNKTENESKKCYAHQNAEIFK